MRQTRYDVSYKYRARGPVKNYGGNTCVTTNKAGLERGFEQLEGRDVMNYKRFP